MKIRRSASGFTLMELILVIVLLSIVSLYAAPRFFGKSSFSVYALQEQVISVIRQVQLNRMQSNITDTDGSDDISDNFRLRVSDKCIGSAAACDLNEGEQASRSDVVSDKSFTFSVPNRTNPVVIEFDLRGNPMDSANEDILIRIEDDNGSNRCEVTINSQGYVSKEVCS